ncbi:NUDIX hydrolase [Cytobacillus horneckiae]|uniref:NUDIX hydrolase n=1 Tax=Cytobacillus horneckiae TaxID=549687 RepID=UPI003D9A986B
MTLNNIAIVVSVSIIKDDEVLLIKEKTSSGITKWNFPSGRMELAENIKKAAVREVKEETGLDVQLIETSGVYNFVSDSNNQVILFHFVGRAYDDSVLLLEEGVVDYKWMKLSELECFMVSNPFRNSAAIKQIARRMLNKEFFPLALFSEQI